MELFLVHADEHFAASSHDAAIHMYNKNKDVLTSLHVKYPRISLGDLKAKVSRHTDKCVVPFLPSLFKPVEQLPKTLHHIHPWPS
jgi:hypothetical protein